MLGPMVDAHLVDAAAATGASSVSATSSQQPGGTTTTTNAPSDAASRSSSSSRRPEAVSWTSKKPKKAKRLGPAGAADLRGVLEREIEAANSRAALDKVANQVEEVRAIMERNVEMILDRGERLDALESKSDALSEATLAFKKQARKLKRWHLMNQVKWGVAVGSLVTASVAIPIVILAAA
mmetsp:Transcript_7584/g.31398  ORF Transcript_7584/g.31398 Transcript_7584/m.31398 type:complete len:181 (+) Transcript_7584:609-1151(+)